VKGVELVRDKVQWGGFCEPCNETSGSMKVKDNF
jgi:hypothetical protein